MVYELYFNTSVFLIKNHNYILGPNSKDSDSEYLERVQKSAFLTSVSTPSKILFSFEK